MSVQRLCILMLFPCLSAGIGGKKRDAVVTTSKFTVTSSNGKINKNSSYAFSISASTANSEKLPIVGSICSVPVETAVSMEVGANFRTQSMEVSTFEKGSVLKIVQSPTTQFNNSMAPDLHLSGNAETHAVECENQANVADKDESHSGSIQLDPG